MTSVESAVHPVRRESAERRDPREVFREFLDHLGRVAHRRPEKRPKPNGRQSGKRS